MAVRLLGGRTVDSKTFHEFADFKVGLDEAATCEDFSDDKTGKPIEHIEGFNLNEIASSVDGRYLVVVHSAIRAIFYRYNR
jgi:hypothetical protein